MGSNIATTINMIFKVMWLETASQMVKLILASWLEGIMNGNRDAPKVIIMPNNMMLEQMKPKPGLPLSEHNNANRPPANAKIGNAKVQLRSL